MAGGRKRKHPSSTKHAAPPPTEWRRLFVCLSSSKQEHVPDVPLRVKLERAGLGEKEITVPTSANARQVHELLLAAFPALRDKAYELLRTTGYGKKDLNSIGHVTASHVLKRNLGHAKCYIRPIVDELDLTPREEEEEDEDTVQTQKLMRLALN